MRLNDAAGTIIQHGSRLSHWREEKAGFPLVLIGCFTTMYGISSGISSESGTQGVWSLALRNADVVGSHYLLEDPNGILSDQINADHHI
jgi:hypothetical protein